MSLRAAPQKARASRGLLALVVVIAAFAIPQPTIADEHYGSPSGGPYSLIGRGFGHGRGMSQYGAYRAGTLGISGEAITNRYYSASSLGTIGDPLFLVQIGSVEDDRSVRFPTTPGLVARDEQTTEEQPIDADAFPNASMWRVVTDAAGLRVQYEAGTQWISVPIGDRDVFGSTVRIFTNEMPTTSILDEDELTERPYRGNFRVHRLDSARISLVNVVLLETYLRSVVPSEVPSYWPSSTLEAQAIAARSYAGYYYQNPRVPGRYHICDSQSCQVYSGSAKERPSSDAAVSDTRGRARVIGSAIVRAEFSSSNGGWVAKGGAGHGGPGYDDWTDGAWDPSRFWQATIGAPELASMIGPGYSLSRMRILERDGTGEWGGRVKAVELQGSSGGVTTTKVVSGDDIRRRFGLRSTLFTVQNSTEVRWQVAAGLSPSALASTHTYGPMGSWLVVGDWDGDGVATPGVLSADNGEWRWRLSAENDVGPPEFDFRYGPTSCRPIAGDWNGDGVDSPGLACSAGDRMRWRLSNVNARSAPALDFLFGAASARPVAGRWAGAGGDVVGTVEPSEGQLLWRLRGENTAGEPTWTFSYGSDADRPITGDWDGDGTTGIGIVRALDGRWLWKVRETASPGLPSATFSVGLTSQSTLVGGGTGQPSRPMLAG